MAKKKTMFPYLVALVLFVGGLGALVATGFSQGSVYFLNVSEALAKDVSSTQNVRLFGRVMPADLRYSEERTSVEFTVADKMDRSQTVRVAFTGAIPDTFKEDVEVILEGKFVQTGQFEAASLVTKCPSKYEEESKKMENARS